MKQIIVFGAGKSSTVLIEYLSHQAKIYNWHITVADADIDQARSKTAGIDHTSAVGADITDDARRNSLIADADIVISLLPPTLHLLIARSCIEYKKNLLTASYIDPEIRALSAQIEADGLLFLCEMGLDPGIDHMSAMRVINDIRKSGGRITSFYSHCGGLVAPESDDNPWHYKISWNPKNVVHAGKAGAIYRRKGEVFREAYEQLFDAGRIIQVPRVGDLSFYPNRDSLPYIGLYGLESTKDFMRTTLRHQEFCLGWKNLIDLRLTDESLQYETDGMSLQKFFQLHLESCGFSDWIKNNFSRKFENTRALLEHLNELIIAEKSGDTATRAVLDEMMLVNSAGDLQKISLEEVKEKAAKTVASQMQEANVSIRQLMFLGMNDDNTIINRGFCSAADVLQFILETKLSLKDTDKDMVVMLHHIGFKQDGIDCIAECGLVLTGEDSRRTAMAKTVGLPLAIAAKLILNGEINSKGLHIPILPEIYNPVLKELEQYDIRFEEKIVAAS